MNAPQDEAEGLRLTEKEKARRARRSVAIGLALAGLCLLFYAISVFKIGSAVLKRTL